MNNDWINDLVATVKDYYPNWQLEAAAAPKVVAIWRTVLGGFDSNEVARAFLRYASEPHQFAPVAGQLAQYVRDERKSSTLTSTEAWERFLKAKRSAVSWERFSEDNKDQPHLLQCARMIGWGRLDSALTTQMTFIAREFTTAYENLEERKNTRQIIESVDKSVLNLVTNASKNKQIGEVKILKALER